MLLTSATIISTHFRNYGTTTDKGCSVLSIACDMPVYITTIILKELYINFNYYYNFFFFYQLQELFLVFEQGWKCSATPLGTRTCWKT